MSWRYDWICFVKAAGAAAYDTVTGGANKVFVDTYWTSRSKEMVGTSLLVFTVFTCMR